jgi:hypothetical protein
VDIYGRFGIQRVQEMSGMIEFVWMDNVGTPLLLLVSIGRDQERVEVSD